MDFMDNFETIDPISRISNEGEVIELTHRNGIYSNLFLTIENRLYDFAQNKHIDDIGFYILNIIAKKIILINKAKNKFNQLIVN